MTSLPPVAVPPSGQVQANLIAMASMLIWAMGFPAVDHLLPHLPPIWLTAMRMTLAALALLPLWLLVEGIAPLRTAPWAAAMAIGAFGFGLGAWFIIAAQQRTDAVTVAVITATLPVVGIAMEAVFDGRRVTGRLVAGLALSLVGGILAYAAGLGRLTLGPGALLAFGSVLVFAWGSRRTAALPISAIGRNAATLTGAALATGVAAVLSTAGGGAAPDWAGLDATDAAALALYGLGSLALSQVLWIVSVSRLGIGVAGMHINVAPFYVMVFALAAGAAWDWWQALGATVVAAGVVLAQGRAR